MKTEKEKAQQLIDDMQADIDRNIFDDSNIPKKHQISAQLGRIGAFQLAILKIKLAFDLPL